MTRRLRKARYPLAWFAAGALLLAAPVSAQEIKFEPGGLISIQASDVPLERLLEALGRISPFEKIVVKDNVGARRVTLTLENVTVTRALVQALNVAGVDFVLGRSRLVVGDLSFGGAANARDLLAPATHANLENRAKARDQADADARAADESQAATDAARHAAEAEIRDAEINRVLTAPRLPIPPGAAVELPFPGPDGRTPMTGVKQPPGPAALPFPSAPSTAPATKRPPGK